MQSPATKAFLDGVSVPVVFDSRSPTSCCPAAWIHGSCHIQCKGGMGSDPVTGGGEEGGSDLAEMR